MTNPDQHDLWHIAYTYSNCEKKVEKRAQELGLETYLPLQLKERQWSDRIKKIEVPLFPNYIFIRSKDIERVYLFQQIKEVVNLVCFDKKPATIKDAQMRTIKKLVASQSILKTETRLCKVGTKVKIKRGAFVGVEGLLVEQNHKNRFLIQIESLGQGIYVDIPISYLSYQ